MTTPDAGPFRARLEAAAAELRARLEDEDESGTVELDQTRQGRLSRMDALQRQEMAKEARRRRERELLRVEAALARIEEGEFGYCASCGEPIAPKRLELDPATPVCIACAGRS